MLDNGIFRLGGGDLDGDGTLIEAVLLIFITDFCMFSRLHSYLGSAICPVSQGLRSDGLRSS